MTDPRGGDLCSAAYDGFADFVEKNKGNFVE
jgi:hypothetical protein